MTRAEDWDEARRAGRKQRGLSWRDWAIPESVRNLLAINSLGCVRNPHIRREIGLHIDIYRLSRRPNGHSIRVLGTFRVDNVSPEMLCQQIQICLDWVNGVI